MLAEPYVVLDKIVVRLRPLLVAAGTAAVVVSTHLNLLPLSQTWRNVVELVCLIVNALVNPPVSRYVEPRVDQDLSK